MKTEYRLDELFDLQMGKTPARNNPEYWDSEDYKWISIADLSKCGKYIIDTKEYLSEKAVQESGISQIPENTVIMSFKLSIGKTAITPEPMYSNEAIMSFRDKHITELLPDYLYYMFSGRDWEAGTNKAVMGKTLNKATLSATRIKVHSIDEQRDIVAVLDKVKSVLDSREEELRKLDELINARFVEMFGDIITNPYGLEESAVKERCKMTQGVESNGWDAPSAFAYLSPLAMDNVIYQAHMYIPHEFTHQGVGGRKWDRCAYPDEKKGWNRAWLRRQIEPVVAFGKRHGARIYFGEFSAIAWADGADRYIADVASIFEEFGFDWTYHAFREWRGWSVEHECDRPDGKFRISDDNARMRALKSALRAGR